MNFLAVAILVTASLLAGMLLFSELGRRLGVARLKRDPEALTQGTGAAEGAVFGLLGLLIAFSFSGAAGRFDDRKQLISEEANMIGTAYLRIDLMPADLQPEMRELFRSYLDTRLATYQSLDNWDQINANLKKGEQLQLQIWAKGVEASRRTDVPAPTTALLLNSINEMLDITTTRLMAARNHPPAVVFVLLSALSLVGALLVGYATSTNRERSWLHNLIFALVLSLTVFVIADLEYPRLGLITVEGSDQVLLETREAMN